jgi:23S rRNA pseudouridine1911/1915/1917 synthase
VAYEIKQIHLAAPRKVVYAIVDALGTTERSSKRLVDKGRVKCNGVTVERKGQVVDGLLEVLFYEPTPLTAVEIAFEHEDFAVFDKPAFMLVHPNSFETKESLLDSIKERYGIGSNITHRLDYETSGLVLASRNKKSESVLKIMFENRQVQKTYLALLQGKLEEVAEVKTYISKCREDGLVKVKQTVSAEGKESVTIFEPIEYLSKFDATFVRVRPLTGRLHQIRLHSAHLGLPIFGEFLYGVDEQIGADHLDKKLSAHERWKLTRANRICLHAETLSFEYGERFSITSKTNALDEFLNALKAPCD